MQECPGKLPFLSLLSLRQDLAIAQDGLRLVAVLLPQPVEG